MTENLNELVDEFQGNVVPETHSETETNSETETISAIVSPNDESVVESDVTVNSNLYMINETSTVPLICFPDWIDKYYNNSVFSPDNGIRCPKTVLNGVDSRENLLFTVPHLDGGVDANGAIKREVRMMYGTLSMFILDLPPVSVTIYKNNSVYILHHVRDNIYIKCYVLKTGSIIIYCYKNEDILIPYYTEKIKRKNNGVIKLVEPNEINITTRFSSDLENSDYENVVLFYRQISKSSSTFTNRSEILKWFSDKGKEIGDINHLIKIDGIMQYILDGILTEM